MDICTEPNDWFGESVLGSVFGSVDSDVHGHVSGVGRAIDRCVVGCNVVRRSSSRDSLDLISTQLSDWSDSEDKTDKENIRFITNCSPGIRLHSVRELYEHDQDVTWSETWPIGVVETLQKNMTRTSHHRLMKLLPDATLSRIASLIFDLVRFANSKTKYIVNTEEISVVRQDDKCIMSIVVKSRDGVQFFFSFNDFMTMWTELVCEIIGRHMETFRPDIMQQIHREKSLVEKRINAAIKASKYQDDPSFKTSTEIARLEEHRKIHNKYAEPFISQGEKIIQLDLVRECLKLITHASLVLA